MSAAASAPNRGATAPRFGAFVRGIRGRVVRGVTRAVSAAGRGIRALAGLLWPLFRLGVRVVAPRLAILSTAGWLAAAIAAVSLVAGFVLGWQELTYLGFALVIALAACVFFILGRATYQVSIELTPSRVVVGQRALGRMLVTNSGPKPLLPARMELPVGAGLAEFSLPGLKPGEEHDELFAVPTNRRAVIIAGPAVSVRGDQLGLLRRTVRWTDPIELFVHPRTVPLKPSAAGLVRDLEGQVTRKITNNDLSFHALREYHPGDDQRYVHWKSTARNDQLMVRQFEETRRSQLTIIHSEFSGYYASDEEFELAVSVTASLGAQIIRDDTQLSVVTETRRLHTYSPSVLLDDTCRLALVGRQYGSAREFARDVTRRLPPPSVVLVVAGSQMTTADYRGIEMLFPSDTTMIAFRIEVGAEPALRSVSELLVATIGELSDLPRVIARAGS